jgi:hypothetical protein
MALEVIEKLKERSVPHPVDVLRVYCPAPAPSEITVRKRGALSLLVNFVHQLRARPYTAVRDHAHICGLQIVNFVFLFGHMSFRDPALVIHIGLSGVSVSELQNPQFLQGGDRIRV